jgi:transcriptional regulator with XRE-family HTH domain
MTKGDRLKQFREHIGLGQSDFAKQVGLSQPHLSAMENGTREISAAVQFKIAEEYKQLNLDWLHHGRGEMLYKSVNKHTQKNTPNEILTHLIGVNESETTYKSGATLVAVFDNYRVYKSNE